MKNTIQSQTKRGRLYLCIGLAVVAAVFHAADAHAVTFSYAGFITEVQGQFRPPNEVYPGAPFTGTLTVQDNFQPTDVDNDPNVGAYDVRFGPVSFNFAVPGYAFNSSSTYMNPARVENRSAYDAVSLTADATYQSPGVWVIGYSFRDGSASVLGSDAWTSNFLRETWPEIGIRGFSTSGTLFYGTVAPAGAFLTKLHQNVGVANIYLNATGVPAIEPRSGGPSGNHTIFFVFDRDISGALATVTSGIGSVNSPLSFQGRTVVVNLTGVADDQYLTLSMTNVVDTSGQAVPDASATAGFLVGDANGDGIVNAGDVQQVRARSGVAVNAYTREIYRCDLNGDGSINAGDAFIVRSRSGNSLLP